MRQQLVPLLFQANAAMIPPLLHLLNGISEKKRPSMPGIPLFEALRGELGLGIARGDTIVTANDWYLDRIGYQLHEVVGHKVSEFVAGPRTTPSTGYHEEIVPIRHKQGHIVSFRVYIYPLVTDQSDRIAVFELV